VFVQALNNPMVKLEEDPSTNSDLVLVKGQEILVIEFDWQTPIIDFIIHNKSHPEKKEHEKLPYEWPAISLSTTTCSSTRLPQEPCANASPKETE
jgi:hypothetical protein